MTGKMDCPHVNNTSARIPTIVEPIACSVCAALHSPWLCLTCGLIHCGRYINGHAQHHHDQTKHPLAIDCYALDIFCYICNEIISNQHRLPRSVFDQLNAIHAVSSTSCHGEPIESDESSNSSITSTATDESLVLLSNNGPALSITTNKPSANRRRRQQKTYGVRTRARVSSKMRKSNSTNFLPPAQMNRNNSSSTSNNGRKRSVTGIYYNSGISSENLSNSDLSSNSISLVVTESSETKKRRVEESSGSSGNSTETNGHHHSIRRAKENVLQGLAGTKNDGKHGVVGLRNLGNTCFMNAVLQSLSKIRGFSCYIAHIPPPDELISNSESPPSPTRRIYPTRSRKNRLLDSSQNTFNTFSEGNGLNRTTTLDCSRTEAMEILRTEELLTNELRKILILLNTKGSSAVSPDSLFSIIWEVMPRFRGGQQDAHEFLRYMLDQLHNELIRLIPTFSWNGSNVKSGSKSSLNGNGEVYLKSLGTKSLKSGNLSGTFMSVFGYNSIVTSMFGGILENEVRCSRCGTESRKNDPFLDLSLEIPMGSSYEARLEDCLSNFTDVEELSDNDKYFCSHCKTHQKSTKRFSIQRLPNVLCLHLKRFRWSNYLRTKLDHFVQFPMTSLDMTDYLLDKLHTRGSSNSHIYDLAAVIVHHGTGVGSGHYTAFAKKDGQWYHFNDSAVKPSEESAVAKCKAYILFYTRSEFRL